MKDDGLILSAWSDVSARGGAAVLATVVKVSGSAYRRPGARMLVTARGGRTGSVSGGCLESDVLKKAWWLTADQPVSMQVYDNTSEDDVAWTFGLGCNGVIHLLLERWEAGSKPLTVELLEALRSSRHGCALATVIGGPGLGQKLAIFPDGSVRGDLRASGAEAEVRGALEARECRNVELAGRELFIEYLAPATALLVFGAGLDAAPVVRMASELGWQVTVADGRSHFARADRFPDAYRVTAIEDLSDPLRAIPVDPDTLAVVMSHSYEQDAALVRALTGRGLKYVGVLGPRRRTERMLDEAGLGLTDELHAPVGLDIGADTPEEIALAILSEAQAALRGRAGGMLVRKAGPIHEQTVRAAALTV